MNLIGKYIELRAIEERDLVLLHKWSNDPEIQYWLGGWHTPTSEIVMKQWFNRVTVDNNNLRFAIEHNELGLLGTANLVDINWKDKNAFHGMLLGDKDIRGKGIGVDVVMTIMKYAFEELGLNRIDGSMIEYNTPSLKLYLEKCGWKKEGIKKEWYFRKNRFWDKIIVGITRNEYFEHINATKYWEK
ncbi:MAG TPA: GNAT family protein [Ignavibacteriales bacterium]|nr:GNAT family protein [Ignavibacteriales bacterium]